MTAAVITSVVSAIAAIVVGLLALVGAIRAQRATVQTQRAQREAAAQAEEDRREREEAQARAVVEAQAYQRARESYERIVLDLESQLERNQRTVQRVQDQLERVLTQLSDEQDISSALRGKVRGMQDQIGVLQEENEQFRKTVDKHQRATGELREDLRRAGVDIPDA